MGEKDAGILAIIKNKTAITTLEELDGTECKVTVEYFHMQDGTLMTDPTSPTTVTYEVIYSLILNIKTILILLYLNLQDDT